MLSSSAPNIRRLIYQSVPTSPDASDDLAAILRQSRVNNGLEGVTGVLLATPFRYLQVLEGTPESVGHIFGRIRADLRHFDVRVLHDELDHRHAFADWEMASLSDEDADAVRNAVLGLAGKVEPSVATIMLETV